eukprot:gnl/MRDRNA2_/MRDRNA2_107729_c0_seq1.p1 gnl/MRDRNA2_/MRDRNA2_107729_c0~~gnl/MRDRNA2_/MRDRNA2_107729_c0_seq1.p1  ORF type:complete len:393 (+),score=74.52 gnl/MRDRNA2_/MRDRNA2_107729_c0_seq1:52-1179(+)
MKGPKGKFGKGYGKFGKGKGGMGWPAVDPAKQAAMAQARKERQDTFTAKLIRAIKQGIKRAGGKLPLAQCGAIAEVANLRKDPEWEKDMKAISLGGFIKAQDTQFKMEMLEKTDKHPSAAYVFVLNPDEEDPPEASVPGTAPTESQEPTTETAVITDGMSMMQKYQVLRQNLVATLEHNGCELDVTRVASDVSVRDAKKALPSSVKLVEFLNKFPQNFELKEHAEPDKPPVVVLLCTRIDTAPIPGGWEAAIPSARGNMPTRTKPVTVAPPGGAGVSTRTHFYQPNAQGVVPLSGPQSTYSQAANQAQMIAIQQQAAAHAQQVYAQQAAAAQYQQAQVDYAAYAAQAQAYAAAQQAAVQAMPQSHMPPPLPPLTQ